MSRQPTRITTVRLPAGLYDQAKSVVDTEKKTASGASPSLNDLIVAAVTAYLKIYRRKQIDAAFAAMATDAAYRKEAKLLADEFEVSDWEALRLEEKDLQGRVAS